MSSFSRASSGEIIIGSEYSVLCGTSFRFLVPLLTSLDMVDYMNCFDTNQICRYHRCVADKQLEDVLDARHVENGRLAGKPFVKIDMTDLPLYKPGTSIKEIEKGVLGYIIEKLPDGKLKDSLKNQENIGFRGVKRLKWSEEILPHVKTSRSYEDLLATVEEYGIDKPTYHPVGGGLSVWIADSPEYPVGHIVDPNKTESGLLMVYDRRGLTNHHPELKEHGTMLDVSYPNEKVRNMTFKERLIGTIEINWPFSQTPWALG